MKTELCGPSPSPLEKLLAARVTATWLQVAYYDALSAQSAKGDDGRSKMIQRQQDAAARRHQAALKAMATIKKLLTPALSPIEIASRMGGSGASPSRFREGVAGTVGVLN
jgi:hypothetical protein